MKNLWTKVHVGILDYEIIGSHRLSFTTLLVGFVEYELFMTVRNVYKQSGIYSPKTLNQMLLRLL